MPLLLSLSYAFSLCVLHFLLNFGGLLKRFSFPKKKKLRSRRQFKAVLDRDLCASNGLLILFMAQNDCGHPRLGVSVSKSCGQALVRNRLKRLLREAFRQSQDSIPAGFDYLLMMSSQWSKRANDKANAKEKAKQLTFEQVNASFLALVTALIRKNPAKNS
jgi:ribonuclease P protein component